MNIYVTNHIHSRVVCEALAKGSNGTLVSPPSLLPGPATVYGILRGCGEIIKQCEWLKRDYSYVDHGYFKRGYYGGYFRLCRNSLQAQIEEDRPPDRWEALGQDIRPWGRDGRHLLVCPPSRYLGQFLNINPVKWTDAVVGEIERHTDRPVVVKHKDGTPLSLKDAHCLVTYSSNAAVDALMEGIPVIVLGDHPARELSWTWADIESPKYPDREQWCWNLAHSQFTLDEMADGIDLA